MNLGAFFDLDGTLLALPSVERRFLRYLRWRGKLTAAHGALWLRTFITRAGRGWLAATHGNKAHFTGIAADSVEEFLGTSGGQIALFSEALARMNWHAAQGHWVFLVSGTLQPLAEAVCRRLPLAVTPCATQLEVLDGHWSGQVLGEAVCGMAKARALGRLAAEHNLALRRSFAYGDSWADRGMLETVGNAVAVNPSPLLERLARQRGWPVLRWAESRTPQQRQTHAEEGKPAARETLIARRRSAQKDAAACEPRGVAGRSL